jgi:Transglutaminase-like superfamily
MDACQPRPFRSLGKGRLVSYSSAEPTVVRGYAHRRGAGSLVGFGLILLVVASCSTASSPSGGASASSPGASSSLAVTPSPTQSATVSRDDVIVAGFSVSDDLSSATVDLLNADGVSASGPDGPLPMGSRGELQIPLHFGGVTKPETVTVSLAGLSGDTLQVSYYPSDYYRSIGSDQSGTVILFTTLPRADNPVRQEPDLPSATDSVDVQQQRWTDARYVGSVPPATGPTDEQIRQLFLQFDDLNDPGIGKFCSDSMTGIDTYWAMANHTCFTWCSGYSRILRDFLRSAGVPARYVGLSAAVTVLSNGVLVQSSEGHATVEVWSNGHWRWVDPTFRVLRAVDADGQELSAGGVIEALANPATRDALRFTGLDPTTGLWQTRAYSAQDEQFRDNLARYMSADKIIVVSGGG